MKKKKITLLLVVVFTMFSISCGSPKLEVGDNGTVDTEITKTPIKEMQIGEQNGRTARESLLGKAVDLTQMSFYDYKVDGSINEMTIYLMQVDSEGKWHKEAIAKETILPKESTFLIATDIENMNLYLGLTQDENDLSGRFAIPHKKKYEMITSANFAGVEDIEKGKIIPLFVFYNYEDANEDKINEAFENEKDPSGAKTIYANPKKVKELLGEHFMVAVEFK